MDSSATVRPEALEKISIERKVDAEMTRRLYRSAGFGLFSNIVLAMVLIAGTYTLQPPSRHVIWFGALLLVSLGRLMVNIAFTRASPAIDDLRKWRQIFMFWGWRVRPDLGVRRWVYYETDELLPIVLLMMILAGLTAGAARSLATVPWSYRLYVATTLGPILGRFLMQPGAAGWSLGLANGHLRPLFAQHRKAALRRLAPAVAASFPT